MEKLDAISTLHYKLQTSAKPCYQPCPVKTSVIFFLDLNIFSGEKPYGTCFTENMRCSRQHPLFKRMVQMAEGWPLYESTPVFQKLLGPGILHLPNLMCKRRWTLHLPKPEYVVYTDSKLEHFRKQYFEMQRVGQEGGCSHSKEFHCRLVRNTLTNMVSIVRATTTEFMYPSKNDVHAMAKQLVKYYPVLRDNSVNCKHTWELLFN
ncbi:hypothetical protein SRHO_G00059140 [Serrasalmus rhombeus]